MFRSDLRFVSVACAGRGIACCESMDCRKGCQPFCGVILDCERLRFAMMRSNRFYALGGGTRTPCVVCSVRALLSNGQATCEEVRGGSFTVSPVTGASSLVWER